MGCYKKKGSGFLCPSPYNWRTGYRHNGVFNNIAAIQQAKNVDNLFLSAYNMMLLQNSDLRKVP